MNLPDLKEGDRPPMLRFEAVSIEDRNESIKQNKIVYKDRTKVFARAYGDNKAETTYWADIWVNQLKENLHHEFISQDFYDSCIKRYDGWRKDGEVPIEGTPIKGWTMITAANQQNILSAHILTVEDLAVATEEGMKAIGMNGRAMRDKAKAFLLAQDESAAATEISNLQEEDKVNKSQISALEEKLAELQAQIEKPKRRSKAA